MLERDYDDGLQPIPSDTIRRTRGRAVVHQQPIGFDHDDVVPDMPVCVTFIDAEDGGERFRLPVFKRDPDD